MKKYIVQLQMKVNEKIEIYYHQNITPQTNNQAMNVYTEHITIEKKKAKRFYDKDEAERIKILFAEKYRVTTVLTVK